MFAIVLILEVYPEKVDAFRTAILANAAGARTEPGCLRFEVSEDPSNPTRFAISELYVDEDAVKAHNESPHFQAWCAANAANDFLSAKHVVKGPLI